MGLLLTQELPGSLDLLDRNMEGGSLNMAKYF